MGSKVYISEQTLRRFARMETTFMEIMSHHEFGDHIEVICDGYYKMTIEDLSVALNNLTKNNPLLFEFVAGWLYPLFNELGEHLLLEELMPGFPESLLLFRLKYLPMSDDDLLIWSLKSFYESFDIKQMMMSADKRALDYFDIEGLIESIDSNKFAECMPDDNYDYSELLMTDYVHEWDNSLLLADADTRTREMYREFVLNLVELNDPEAIRILGYSSYGGNVVFPDDVNLARECMEKLWKDFSFGYAAYTLGHMYLKGKFDNGTPDYKQAFLYFSVSASFGVVEAACSMADMFMHGQYVSKNLSMADSILSELYGKALIRFEDGNRETHLADIAVRYGELLILTDESSSTEIQRLVNANRCFLHAKFALTEERKVRGAYVDVSLSKRVEDNLARTSKYFKQYKSSHKSDYPSFLEEFVSSRGFCNYSMEASELKNNRFKITVRRNRRGAEPTIEKSLLAHFDFNCCELTSEISFIADKVRYPDKLRNMDSSIVFDTVESRFDKDRNLRIAFLADGTEVMAIEADGYIVKAPKR